MLTFKQFLNEAPHQTLIDFIAKNCKPFLKELGLEATPEDAEYAILRRPLYRGMHSPSGTKIDLIMPFPLHDGRPDISKCYIITTREDRAPKDMDSQISKIVDDSFAHEFTFRGRSKATFIYGAKGLTDAGSYGPAYQIFPIGEFRYLWSPTVRDLHVSLFAILRSLGFDIDHETDTSADPQQLDKFKLEFKDMLKTYTTKDLDVAAQKNNEIMLGCKTYLAVPLH